jgi:hypothetical protein
MLTGKSKAPPLARVQKRRRFRRKVGGEVWYPLHRKGS